MPYKHWLTFHSNEFKVRCDEHRNYDIDTSMMGLTTNSLCEKELLPGKHLRTEGSSRAKITDQNRIHSVYPSELIAICHQGLLSLPIIMTVSNPESSQALSCCCFLDFKTLFMTGSLWHPLYLQMWGFVCLLDWVKFVCRLQKSLLAFKFLISYMQFTKHIIFN